MLSLILKGQTSSIVLWWFIIHKWRLILYFPRWDDRNLSMQFGHWRCRYFIFSRYFFTPHVFINWKRNSAKNIELTIWRGLQSYFNIFIKKRFQMCFYSFYILNYFYLQGVSEKSCFRLFSLLNILVQW